MDTNVKFTDPFYGDEYSISGQFKEFDSQGEQKKESSYALRTEEESGDYDYPALPGGAPPAYSLPTAGGTPTPSTSSTGKVDWKNIVDKAPAIIGGIGALVGTAQNIKQQKGSGGEDRVRQICGRKPNLGKQRKLAYQQCVERVLNPPQTSGGDTSRQGEEMSKRTKLFIGIGIFVFLIIIAILIIVLSKNKQKTA